MGVQIPTREVSILRGEVAGPGHAFPGHVRQSIYSKRLSRGRPVPVLVTIGGIVDGVHIGATWRIRFNRPCAAAMRPYVKLL